MDQVRPAVVIGHEPGCASRETEFARCKKFIEKLLGPNGCDPDLAELLIMSKDVALVLGEKDVAAVCERKNETGTKAADLAPVLRFEDGDFASER